MKLNRLDGYKTHIQAVLIGIASAAHYMGWIDTQAYMLIVGLLGAGTVSSLHQAVTRTPKDNTATDNEAE